MPTFHVSTTGNDTTGNGSESTPYLYDNSTKIPGDTIILGLVLVATTDVEIELEPETAAPNSIVQNVSALSNNTTNFGSVLKLQQGEYTISEPIGLTGPKSVLLVATNGPLRILRINYI